MTSATRRLRTMALLGAVLLVGLLLFVGSGILLAWPHRSAAGAPPDDVGATAITIPSPSGSLLQGWLVRGKTGSGAVVLLHGVYATRRAMHARLRFLREAGYALLAIDFQAHGESPGAFVTFGHLEALDAEAAVAFARESFAGERIGVIGVSLGGAAALLAPGPLRVDALVLESVYPDIRSAIANRVSTYLGATAGAVVAAGYLRLMPPILGAGEDQLRPIDRVGAVTAPLLVMSGATDRYTTIAEAQSLFEVAPEPKEFWAIPGAAHIDLAAHAPDAYRQHVLGFLARHLRDEAPIPR